MKSRFRGCSFRVSEIFVLVSSKTAVKGVRIQKGIAGGGLDDSVRVLCSA